MATLVQHISDLAARIAAEFKAVRAEHIKGLNFFCGGKPAADEVIGGGFAPYAFTVDPDNCRASALVAPTADALIILNKNGAAFCAVFFLAGQTDGEFQFTNTAVAFDDHITALMGPTPDPTLADITIKLQS